MAIDSFDPNKYLDTPTYEKMSGTFTAAQVLKIADTRIKRQAEIQAKQNIAIQTDRADAAWLLQWLELDWVDSRRAPLSPPQLHAIVTPWELATLPINVEALGQQMPQIDHSLSERRNEDPQKLKLFQDFITNLNSNVPKIYSNAELNWVQKAIAEMTKNPEHHAQFNAALTQLFGKNIQIDPGSIQDTWFAFLSFKWNDGKESKEFSLWMNSTNVRVAKNWFSPDEYKTNSTWNLATHTPDKLKKA